MIMTIAVDVSVSVCLCLYVGHLIKMPFGLQTCVGQMNLVLHWDTDPLMGRDTLQRGWHWYFGAPCSPTFQLAACWRSTDCLHGAKCSVSSNFFGHLLTRTSLIMVGLIFVSSVHFWLMQVLLWVQLRLIIVIIMLFLLLSALVLTTKLLLL